MAKIERDTLANCSPRYMSPAELDDWMWYLQQEGKDDTRRFESLQREHDRRNR